MGKKREIFVMNNSLRTSVVIGTYNGEKYIGDQLESIINQTVKPDEIIISDDNSSDNTVSVVKEVLENSGIKYIINENPKQLGILDNYEKCHSLSTGDIIFLCDQDNVWDSKYIELFMEIFKKHPKVDYVFCNGYVTDECLNILRPSYTDGFMNKSKSQFLDDVINKRGFPHGHTIAYKKQFKDRVSPPYFVLDEWMALCAAASGNYEAIDKNLVYFRRHKNTFSKTEKETQTAGGSFTKKLFIIKDVIKQDFDKYFVWPEWQYKAYEKIIELFEDNLEKDVICSLKIHSEFEKELYNLRYKHKFNRLRSLARLYHSEEYKKYRGTRNTFIIDSLYLFFKIERKSN